MPILEYELRTHHPTKRGNIRLRVEETGEVFGTRNRTEPVDGDWTGDWGPALRRIDDPAGTVTALLEAGGFFDMPPAIVGTGQDGVREVLRYSGTRGERTVVVDRSHVPAFQALVSRLLWGLDVADEFT
jgi:hypothetical protein